MGEIGAVLVSAVLPVALVALVGVWIGRRFSLDLRTLARVNIYALLPALVITGLYESELALGSALGIVVGFLLNCGVLYGVAIALGRVFRLPIESRKSLVATTLLANSGNIGLPFILFALGEAGLARAIVYLVASSIFIASVGPIILKGEGVAVGMRVTLSLPVFWATLGGIILLRLSWAVPVPIDRALQLLSGAAIPVSLLTLGIQLSQTRLNFGWYELFAACLRLFVSPLSAFTLGRLLGLEGLDLTVLVMQSAMPVAVNTLIWVTELGGDTDRVAKTIVLSTIMSFATLPGVLWLMGR
ncbi:MAG: transporter [Leptolyngbya foveolarum]|uniref:Transporter n=1 Tax=Leptolyngbya foveolarum TaxID=47253 RepID=A0A2W4TWK4_9CYAN|nr:MAG: transporter [Leptolyngbya foveolarum]